MMPQEGGKKGTVEEQWRPKTKTRTAREEWGIAAMGLHQLIQYAVQLPRKNDKSVSLQEQRILKTPKI